MVFLDTIMLKNDSINLLKTDVKDKNSAMRILLDKENKSILERNDLNDEIFALRKEVAKTLTKLEEQKTQKYGFLAVIVIELIVIGFLISLS